MSETTESTTSQNSPLFNCFGRYKVIRLLGQGAMGKVFLSEDPVLQRQIAIKVISLEHYIDNQTKQEFLQRFTFEALASARLSHPSIVTIYDAGEQNGVPWIAFEFINGESLEQLLHKEKKLSFDIIRSIILQIASAIDHAQQYQIIHRDIKPANILIDSKSGIAKLSDFGVVKTPWVGLTQSGVSVGSPGYMSPEQIDGSEVDTRSDLFSFGVVLYELITGKHPFLKDSIPATLYATINQDYVPLKQLRPDIPEDLEKAVTCLLKGSKDERIPSAKALISLINNDSPITTKHAIPAAMRLPISWQSFKNQTHSFYMIILKAITGILKKEHHILQSVINTFHTLEKKLHTLSIPFRKATPVTLIMVLFCTFLLSAVIFFKFSKPNTEPQAIAKSESVPSCVRTFDSLLNAENTDSAYKLIKEISVQQHPGWPDLLQGRLELKKGNYSTAEIHLKKTQQVKKSLIKLQLNDIMNELETALQKGKATDSLIKLAVQILEISDYKRIKGWLNHNNYWIRWNSVKIMQDAGKNVDMVSIYLLDLNSTASMRTRIRAAEKLGESGDRRAVPLLQEIGARRIRDPFVSATARNVLNKYFKDSLLQTQ